MLVYMYAKYLLHSIDLTLANHGSCHLKLLSYADMTWIIPSPCTKNGSFSTWPKTDPELETLVTDETASHVYSAVFRAHQNPLLDERTLYTFLAMYRFFVHNKAFWTVLLTCFLDKAVGVIEVLRKVVDKAVQLILSLEYELWAVGIFYGTSIHVRSLNSVIT